MVRGQRPKKVAEWTRRLERYAASGQTVAEFCRGEGVSQPSFYQWKKQLADSLKNFQLVGIASISGASQLETIVRLGRDIEIKLGGDLAIVECVIHQLLAATVETVNDTRGESC